MTDETIKKSSKVSLTDSIELKHTQEALEKSENKYKILVEHQSDMIVKVDVEGNFLYVSPSYCRLFGKTEEELLNKKYMPLIHEGDREKTEIAMKNLFKPPYTCYVEQRAKTKDGWKWLSWSDTAILNDKNEIIEIIGLGQDISKRKEMEDVLRGNEIKSQYWLENSPVCTKIVDLDLNLQYMSSAGIRALEIDDITEFYGKPYPLKFSPDPFKTVMINNFKEAKKTGKIIKQEAPIFSSSGKEIWFHSTIVPVNDDKGKLDYIMVVSSDINERKQAERDLETALERALESDRLKSAFLANISHEIRTPMNGIMGFIDLLDAPGLSDSKKHEFINVVKESSNRLLNTINDLIDISKIESGQVKISKSDICINKLFGELYTFFEPEIKAKGLSLIFSAIPDKEKNTFFVDNDKLYAVLRNLIKNSIKYTDKGSISYACTLKGDFIEFFVEDTGIGVPEDRQEAIFDSFIQADMGDTRAFEGSGLGLSIARAYVKIMGGEMSLISEEGKGAKFIFTISLAKA